MSHYKEYYEALYYGAAEEERLLKLAKADKKYIEESLKRIQDFQRSSYTMGLQHEFTSIEKFYKAKLYDLRHIDIDS